MRRFFIPRTAIVHDWLVTNAGAEKVLRAMLDIYPDADVFSLVDFLSDKDREAVLKGKYASTSFIQNLPFAKKHFRNYLPFFPMAIESLDLRGYDLIISGSWAVAKGVKHSKDQTHICYCHTPIRYAWDLYEEYTSNLSQPKKIITQLVLKYIRNWDKKTIDRVDHYIANSSFVAERIKRTYSRESAVIYPPVNIDKFAMCDKKENYYITASRLVPYKKVKLIVESFNKMPDKKLVVIGSGEELDIINRIAGSNIEVMGYQEDDVLIKRMQKAKAFVYAAVEDFGIVPVEALACGTPVIALGTGGTAETVKDGVNGVHFSEQTAEAIVSAVGRFEKLSFEPSVVRETALRYTNFQETLSSYIQSKLQG